VDEWRLNSPAQLNSPESTSGILGFISPVCLKNSASGRTASTRQKIRPIRGNNLRRPISGEDNQPGATTDSGAYHYRGQMMAINPQTKLFDMCLECFWWVISYVRGSQVVRRGDLSDAQMRFQSSYGLYPIVLVRALYQACGLLPSCPSSNQKANLPLILPSKARLPALAFHGIDL
jgi:hypothetical protein